MPKGQSLRSAATQEEKQALYAKYKQEAQQAYPYLPDGAIQQIVAYYLLNPKRFDETARDMIKENIEKGKPEHKAGEEITGMRVIKADDPEYLAVLNRTRDATTEPSAPAGEPVVGAGGDSEGAEYAITVTSSEEQPGVSPDPAQ